MLLRTLRCERTTPFGSPVEPEVKITVAVRSSWSPRRPGRNLLSSAIGRTRATAAAQALSVHRTCLGRSSRWIKVPLGTILNLSSTLGDVRTCVIPHWSIEESTRAWLAV